MRLRAGDSPEDDPQEAAVVNRSVKKEIALIQHLAKLEDKHRSRVHILNNIEDRRLNNTLRKMDFAMETVRHSLDKQQRTFQRSLATINQRQKEIVSEHYYLDHGKLKAKSTIPYMTESEPEWDQGIFKTSTSIRLHREALPCQVLQYGFKDKKYAPWGRWVRYPANYSLRHGRTCTTRSTSAAAWFNDPKTFAPGT